MISEIEKNQSLFFKNVLQVRKKVAQNNSFLISNEIDNFIEKNGAKKDGNTITITHNVTIENGEQVFDLEMMIPLNKEIEPFQEYNFLPEFLLNNALKVRIEGNPQQMQSAVQRMSEYVKNENLNVTTPLYVVTIKEAKTNADIDDMITELYIGVK